MKHFPEYRLAYFHIPKTGGTSMNAFLQHQLGGSNTVEVYHIHEPMFFKKQKLGEEFLRTKVLATIRNPYDHAVSCYFFYRYYYPKLRGLSFDDFVTWYTAPPEDNENLWLQKDNFFSWLQIDGKIPNNVVVLKLEELQQSIRHAFQWPEPLYDVEHRNRTWERNQALYEYYTNPDTIKKVTRFYNWTFDKKYYKRWNNADQAVSAKNT